MKLPFNIYTIDLESLVIQTMELWDHIKRVTTKCNCFLFHKR